MSAAMKEPTQSVYMRIKQSNHDWLKNSAAAQDRSVTWIVNKLIEQVKQTQEASNATAA